MKRGHVKDLTSGPILIHLRALAIPAALGMLFHTLYNITDVYFASMLSTDSQSGLSLGYLVFFFIAAFQVLYWSSVDLFTSLFALLFSFLLFYIILVLETIFVKLIYRCLCFISVFSISF